LPTVVFSGGIFLENTITVFPIIRPRAIIIGPEPASSLQEELEDQNWRLISLDVNGTTRYGYEGEFRGKRHRYRGFVWCDDNSVSILNLPTSAKRGKHGICFSRTRDGWYLAHFNRGTNPLARICAIEEYLKEVGE
jgi:hypothetical protein